MTRRLRGSQAGNLASPTNLPVLYFYRIRVRRLQLHLHLSHEDVVPLLRGRQAHSSLISNSGTGKPGKTAPGLGGGPSSPCRSRSFVVCRLEVAKLRLLPLTHRRFYVLLILFFQNVFACRANEPSSLILS